MNKVVKEVLIKNKQGLHARPAALFVQTAAKFDSSVRIKKDNQLVDGKSIMSILSLGAESGNRITIIAEGEDAQRAVLELEKILTEDNEEN
ncbi:MAG TPA: HPr family phosphocarrier protein [Candidatus Omnitrophica bacterium]|nr:MAG: HPr family phosphocarrier protein [Candidatus Omnitrophota bacterium]RKY35494.1 MAG: HPr family phosphocarrier protein [Candidatus Omnitrophota bacterium]RKY45067.1 MAG: HPr family phosphocarrier protein [Candidatus Omnitrophota bacterium]HEC69034.1 HPr family phosphocarrier protein [Candidatus Omnitrophota bacterium]